MWHWNIPWKINRKFTSQLSQCWVNFIQSYLWTWGKHTTIKCSHPLMVVQEPEKMSWDEDRSQKMCPSVLRVFCLMKWPSQAFPPPRASGWAFLPGFRLEMVHGLSPPGRWTRAVPSQAFCLRRAVLEMPEQMSLCSCCHIVQMHLVGKAP